MSETIAVLAVYLVAVAVATVITLSIQLAWKVYHE